MPTNVFMDVDGYPAMSGHGVVAAVTAALERGLLVVPQRAASGAGQEGAGKAVARREIALTLDTPAGIVGALVSLPPGGLVGAPASPEANDGRRCAVDRSACGVGAVAMIASSTRGG
jgi:proline racemase